jgi:hypothetical protein
VRLLSCRCRQAMAWADALPTAPSLRLSDSAVYNTIRLQFGAVGRPACPRASACACGLAGASRDHAMVCNALFGKRTMRHHMLTNAWRRVCSRAEGATSLEPHLDRLDRTVRFPGQRGDLLLARAPGPQVADVSVTHPAAATYVTGAARTTGSAAARRDALKCRQYAKDSDGLPYALVPLTSETFVRLGGPAMDHLSAMADLAVSDATPGADVSRGRFIDGSLRELAVSLKPKFGPRQ